MPPDTRHADAALAALRKAREIIDTGETRALSTDGPVGHCRTQLSDGEFDMMWSYVEKAMRLLERVPR